MSFLHTMNFILSFCAVFRHSFDGRDKTFHKGSKTFCGGPLSNVMILDFCDIFASLKL